MAYTLYTFNIYIYTCLQPTPVVKRRVAQPALVGSAGLLRKFAQISFQGPGELFYFPKSLPLPVHPVSLNALTIVTLPERAPHIR